MYDLVVCVMACVVIEKYKNEIIKIEETWGKEAQQLGVKVLFMLGEDKVDNLNDEINKNCVYLNGVKNDYESASHKQNLGLKYIHENYDTKFVYVCGSDTFVNIHKLLLFLKQFDYNDNLYIGGHGDYRTILDQKIYFHSGGGGFLLSKDCLNKLYYRLENLFEEWRTICEEMNNNMYFLTACDVCIAYVLQQEPINSKIIISPDFYHCNYRGYPCCVFKTNNDTLKNRITSHLMKSEDFDSYYEILKNNNFFIQ